MLDRYSWSMEVRRIGIDEWEALRDLRLRALAEDPDAFGMTLDDGIRPIRDGMARLDRLAQRGFFAAVADDGSFVAMAVGAPVDDRPGAAGLFGMWVAPEARRAGIGTALVGSVEDWARTAGYERVGLGVTMTNTSAIRLYERSGFVDLGERHPLREGSDLTIQIMAKTL